MQQAEILRNEALGATLVKKLKLRGFESGEVLAFPASQHDVQHPVHLEEFRGGGGAVGRAGRHP